MRLGRNALILLVTFLCAGCAGVFSKNWQVGPPYCQSGGDHLATGDELNTSQILFWNGMKSKRGSAERWKLRKIKFDPWTGDVLGTAEIGHEECFKFKAVRVDSGQIAIDIFLHDVKDGEKCDTDHINEAFESQVRSGMCPAGHTGGWRAF